MGKCSRAAANTNSVLMLSFALDANKNGTLFRIFRGVSFCRVQVLGISLSVALVIKEKGTVKSG